MQLKLAIGGNVIASVPLNEKKAANLEYIFTKRCFLTEACSTTIAAHNELPEFYIEVSSRMNKAMKA